VSTNALPPSLSEDAESVHERLTLDGLRHRLGCTREAIETWSRQLRLELFYCPDPAAPDRLLASVTLAEARLIIRLAEAQGAAIPDNTSALVRPQIIFPGYFFILQPEPILAPERIHVGFTTDPDRALQKVRDLAPDAAFVKVWPCERLWSGTVTATCTRDCTLLRENLFLAQDLPQVLAYADAIFGILPSAETRTRLVTHRPRASRLARAASSTYRAHRPVPPTAPAAFTVGTPARPASAAAPTPATPSAAASPPAPVPPASESPAPPCSPRLRVTIPKGPLPEAPSSALPLPRVPAEAPPSSDPLTPPRPPRLRVAIHRRPLRGSAPVTPPPPTSQGTPPPAHHAAASESSERPP
jgi:hypothetical protein